jgi:hypothetical protein
MPEAVRRRSKQLSSQSLTPMKYAQHKMPPKKELSPEKSRAGLILG